MLTLVNGTSRGKAVIYEAGKVVLTAVASCLAELARKLGSWSVGDAPS